MKSLFKWLKGSISLYFISIILMIVIVFSRTYIPLFFKHVIDNIIVKKQDFQLPQFIIDYIDRGTTIQDQLLITAAIIITLQILRGFLMFVRGTLNTIATEGLALRIRAKLYSHIQDLSFGYHNKAETGDLIQRSTSDVETIRNFYQNQLTELVRSFFFITFSLYQMFNLSAKLSYISLTVTPIIFIGAYVYFKKIKTTFQAADEAEGDLSNTLQENLNGVRVVKAFANEQLEIEKFDEKNLDYRNKIKRIIDYMALYWSLSDLLVFSQMAITTVYGAYMTINGEITLGDFTAFTFFITNVLWPIRGLGRTLADFGKATVASKRINEVLSEPIEYTVDGKLEPTIEGNIEFENVSFKFDDSETHMLDNISFKLNAGETLAIVGKTGSGKSTLVHLLIRFLEYQSGSIKIDNTDLKDIKKHWVRDYIKLNLQEPFLFSKTISQNINIMKSANDDKAIHNVASIAEVHNDIKNFEKGYETPVGERGVTLSGGQKQRVSIARLLLSDKTKIYIFDDSLSAVDTETDQKIRNSLNNLPNNITTIIITHRIATAKNADKIIVLDKGKIIQMGKHEELKNQDGIYKNICDIQEELHDDLEKIK